MEVNLASVIVRAGRQLKLHQSKCYISAGRNYFALPTVISNLQNYKIAQCKVRMR
jgi:hypothetical protein